MGQLERSKIVVLLAEVEGIELLVTGQCICACHRGANASIPQRTAFSKLQEHQSLSKLMRKAVWCCPDGSSLWLSHIHNTRSIIQTNHSNYSAAWLFRWTYDRFHTVDCQVPQLQLTPIDVCTSPCHSKIPSRTTPTLCSPWDLLNIYLSPIYHLMPNGTKWVRDSKSM